MTTKITYLPDPKNPARVVTVASRVVDLVEDPNREWNPGFRGQALAVGVAINQPTEWKTQHESGTFIAFRKCKGDVFNKKTGRMIAEGRLNTRPEYMPVAFAPDATPMKRLLLHLAWSDNGIVRRAAVDAATRLNLTNESNAASWS